MLRIGGLLLVVACSSGTREAPHNRSEPRWPEPGVYMTPEAEPTGDDYDNQLYVSVWEDRGEPVLGLLCRAPCLPNVRKPYSSDAESYRSERVRRVAPNVWEATMRVEATLRNTRPPELALRFDLTGAKPAVEFGGHRSELQRVSFQDASYHLMSREGQREAMLFTRADLDEVLIKQAPPDDTFLYLSPASAKVQTVHARNWHYRLDAVEHPDDPGAYFAVLHGDLALPDGAATLDLDVLRNPESDVAFWLTRTGKPKVRFAQSNDSNTHRFTSCTSAGCTTVYLGVSDAKSKCPGADPSGRFAIWLDAAGNGRVFVATDKDQLLDRQCKLAYTYAWAFDEGRLVLTDPAGAALTLTKPPETP